MTSVKMSQAPLAIQKAACRYVNILRFETMEAKFTVLKHFPEMIAHGEGSLHWKAIANSAPRPQRMTKTSNNLFITSKRDSGERARR